jgi:hypothetical protein
MPVNRVLLCISFLVFFTVLPNGEVNAQEQILDDFETPGGWKIIVSDGVMLNIASDKGFCGNSHDNWTRKWGQVSWNHLVTATKTEYFTIFL